MSNSVVQLSDATELETLRDDYGRDLNQTFGSVSSKEEFLERLEAGQMWSETEAAHRERGHDFVYQGIAYIVHLVSEVQANPDLKAVFEGECEKRKIGKPDDASNPYTPYLAVVFGNWVQAESASKVWVKNKSWLNLGGVVRYFVGNRIAPRDVADCIKNATCKDHNGEERTRLEAIKVMDRIANPPKANSGKTAFGSDANRLEVINMQPIATASVAPTEVQPNKEGLTLMVARVGANGTVEVLYDAKLGHDIIMRGVRKGLA